MLVRQSQQIVRFIKWFSLDELVLSWIIKRNLSWWIVLEYKRTLTLINIFLPKTHKNGTFVFYFHGHKTLFRYHWHFDDLRRSKDYLKRSIISVLKTSFRRNMSWQVNDRDLTWQNSNKIFISIADRLSPIDYRVCLVWTSNQAINIKCIWKTFQTRV